MRCGFDQCGGFYVIDHERERAAYSYPSSPNADAAKIDPLPVARKIAAGFYLDDQPLMSGIELDIYHRLRDSDRPEWLEFVA